MRQKGQYKALQNRYDFAITIGKNNWKEMHNITHLLLLHYTFHLMFDKDMIQNIYTAQFP